MSIAFTVNAKLTMGVRRKRTFVYDLTEKCGVFKKINKLFIKFKKLEIL